MTDAYDDYEDEIEMIYIEPKKNRLKIEIEELKKIIKTQQEIIGLAKEGLDLYSANVYLNKIKEMEKND